MQTGLSDELARTIDVDAVDRDDVDALLADPPPGVASATAALVDRLGRFPGELRSAQAPHADESAWICAIVRFVPEVLRWHAAHGVDASISAATLADVGRQFRLHRVTHGRFGLETWEWLTLHLAGNLFHLGRLQFALRPTPDEAGWALDVHIPPTGSLDPALVQRSQEEAVRFFRTHFPDRPVDRFVCFSWLLDPYLVEQLPESNIARFQQRFDRVGAGSPSDDDVLYFVFRTRASTSNLPRDTSLQRAVLDRIAAGGHWQAFHGTRPSPGSGAPD